MVRVLPNDGFQYACLVILPSRDSMTCFVQSATSGSCAISRTVIPGRKLSEQGKYLGYDHYVHLGNSLRALHDFTFHTLKASWAETLLLTPERIV